MNENREFGTIDVASHCDPESALDEAKWAVMSHWYSGDRNSDEYACEIAEVAIRAYIEALFLDAR